MLLVISAHSVNLGIKERYYISVVFSLTGSVVIELCQQCIPANILLQRVPWNIEKIQIK